MYFGIGLYVGKREIPGCPGSSGWVVGRCDDVGEVDMNGCWFNATECNLDCLSGYSVFLPDF